MFTHRHALPFSFPFCIVLIIEKNIEYQSVKQPDEIRMLKLCCRHMLVSATRRIDRTESTYDGSLNRGG